MGNWFVERPVGEMRPGDHAWLPFSAEQEQQHIIGAFLSDGLTCGEKVVCIGDAGRGLLPARGLDPDRFLQTGQLRALTAEQALSRRGRMDPDQLSRTLEREIAMTFAEGYRAVRLTIDLNWALLGPGGIELVLACEHQLEATVARSAMAMTICQFDQTAYDPGRFAELTHTHEVLVAPDPEFDDGVLQITKTYDPFGLRLKGELDRNRYAVFTQTLASVAGARPRVHLDLSGMHFIELGALNILADHATHLPPGHLFVLDNLPPHIHSVIETLGWPYFPAISHRQQAW